MGRGAHVFRIYLFIYLSKWLCVFSRSSNHHRKSWHLQPQSHKGSWVTDRAKYFLFVCRRTLPTWCLEQDRKVCQLLTWIRNATHLFAHFEFSVFIPSSLLLLLLTIKRVPKFILLNTSQSAFQFLLISNLWIYVHFPELSRKSLLHLWNKFAK